MARKSKEAEREYQRKYYEEHIKNNPERKEKKNATQRAYAKRHGSASTSKYHKEKYITYTVNLRYDKNKEIIDMMESLKQEHGGVSEVLKKILNDFLKKY